MDRLWTDFVNSDYHDLAWGRSIGGQTREGELAARFLDRWQLNASVPASPEDELSMRNFRNELMALGARLSSGASLTDIENNWLNGVMASRACEKNIDYN